MFISTDRYINKKFNHITTKKTNKAQYSPENQKDEQHGPHKNTGMANSCAQVGPKGTWLPP
jgi:hypothetical protein